MELLAATIWAMVMRYGRAMKMCSSIWRPLLGLPRRSFTLPAHCGPRSPKALRVPEAASPIHRPRLQQTAIARLFNPIKRMLLVSTVILETLLPAVSADSEVFTNDGRRLSSLYPTSEVKLHRLHETILQDSQ